MISSHLRNLWWRKLIIKRLKKQDKPKSTLNCFVELVIELWFNWTFFSLNVFHKINFSFKVSDVDKTPWLNFILCFHPIVYSWHNFLPFFILFLYIFLLYALTFFVNTLSARFLLWLMDMNAFYFGTLVWDMEFWNKPFTNTWLCVDTVNVGKNSKVVHSYSEATGIDNMKQILNTKAILSKHLS